MRRTSGALLLGSCFVFASGAAAADDAAKPTNDAAKPAKVEEVIVTGSRIARTNLEGLGPITVLSSEDIAASGVNTIDELLRELPSVGFQGISQNANNGGRGLRFVELRNLGSARTLVLVNGHRFVTNGSGVAEAVDVNNVPTGLIERVDVLRDGVSTIYGSDAVAGVINFVLKEDYEGLQAEVLGGISERGDADESGVNLLWGKNWSKTNLTLSANVFNRQPVEQFDRSFARFPVSSSRFNTAGDPSSGLNTIIGSSTIPAGRVRDPNKARDLFFKPGMDASGNPTSFGVYNPNQDYYNFAPSQYLVGEQSRGVFNASFRHELTDSLEFFVDAEYAQRYGRQKLAPVPAGAIASRANPAGLSFPIYADSSRNNPYLPQDFVNTILAGRDSANIVLNRRFNETGERLTDNDSLTQRVVAGFKGELEGPLGPLNWEVFGNYGHNDNEETLRHNLNISRIVASAQPEVCARTPGCVVGNYFGENSLLQTPDAINYIRFTSKDKLGFHLKEFGTSISGGVFPLPAGELKAAVGAEYRQEDGFVKPDALTVSGDSSTNGLDPTRGRFTTRNVFFETTVPILANLPLAEEFTLEISGRYTDYSTFGGKYLSRYGFSWAPVADFRLRGVYATAFRAPGISDLFGGGADSFLGLRDPCQGYPNIADPTIRANCAAALPNSGQYTSAAQYSQFTVGTGQQIRANIGGNPNLQEETAVTQNVGFVYQPSFMPDLAFAVDYYDVRISNPIVNPDAQDVLNDCYESLNLSAARCGVVSRLADGGVGFVGVAEANLGRTRTNGYDFDISYSLDLPLVGPTSLGINGNYVVDYLETDDNGTTAQNGRLTIPNFKGRFTTRFQPMDALSVNVTSRFIGKAVLQDRHEQMLPFDHVPSVWYVDSSARYSLGENYALTFGIRNLADKKPPFVVGAANTSLASYDVIGRFFFARFNVNF